MSERRSLVQRALVGVGVVAGALAAAMLGHACHADRPGSPARPNILFITIDSLRADHLGTFGYRRQTSPAVDRLAARGVLFTRAVSQATWTFGSVPSFITSRYPQTQRRVVGAEDGPPGATPELRAKGKGQRTPGPIVLLGDHDVTLPGLLRSAGYRTALVTDHGGLRQIVGLKDAFDVVDWLGGKREAALFGERARQQLDELAGRQPFFLWAYSNALHYPYRAPPPFDAKFQGDGVYHTGKTLPFSDERFGAIGAIPRVARLEDHQDVDTYVAGYDGCIAAADQAVAEIIAELERLHLDESTLVVVNADHGELLGEEGFYFTHGASLNPANTHVPLLFVLPGGVHGGTRVAGAVGLVDLAPTVLEVAGVSAAPMAPVGHSLAPCFAEPTRCDGGLAFSMAHRADQVGVVSDRWALRCGPTRPCSLFEYVTDIGPTSDRRADHPDDAAALERALDAWKAQFPEGPEQLGLEALDPETLNALRTLGYIR